MDDTLDEYDDDGVMVENGRVAMVDRMEMDQMVDVAGLPEVGGPKSLKRKTRYSIKAKKMKLETVNCITNYFVMNGEKSQGI